jgi:acetate kinase
MMQQRDRRHILCVDGGSSSLKIAVYEIGAEREQCLIAGGIDAIGAADSRLKIRDFRFSPPRDVPRALGRDSPIAGVLAALTECRVRIDAVGHRLVYGGATHELPARVSAELLGMLETLVPFDPLHAPAALAAIRDIQTALPALPQVVCFDTAFHDSMPAVAHRLALPRELSAEGLRRYGFHGLSYESIVRDLGPVGTRGSMIVAHLGSGASLSAMRNGKPIDTTMGFSPLGGLMMGTRPGDLDPGALLYLLRSGRYTPAELDTVLTRESGLFGVSGSSADMRSLLTQRGSDVAAAEAVELFVYQAKKQLGALVAVLGGLDTLVFTGGIGEHAPIVRAEICAQLEYLGIVLDTALNRSGASIISAPDAHVIVRVMAARENLMVARHTFQTLFASTSASGAGTPGDTATVGTG